MAKLLYIPEGRIIPTSSDYMLSDNRYVKSVISDLCDPSKVEFFTVWKFDRDLPIDYQFSEAEFEIIED